MFDRIDDSLMLEEGSVSNHSHCKQIVRARWLNAYAYLETWSECLLSANKHVWTLRERERNANLFSLSALLLNTCQPVRSLVVLS